MKKNILFLVPAALCLLAGCNPAADELRQKEFGKVVDMVFHAGRPPKTRTVMDEYGGITWLDTDRISINGKSSGTATISTNKEYADFHVTSILTAVNYDALYPASLVSNGDTEYNATNGTYTVNFPGEQTWKDNTSFATDVNPSVAHSTNSDLSFLNTCGILKLSIKKVSDKADITDVQRVRFISTGEPVAGVALIPTRSVTPTLAINSTPSTQMDIVFSTNNFPNGQTINNQSITIYMVLPPGTYNKGWKLQLLDNSNPAMVLSETIDKNRVLTIQRSKITHLGTVKMKPIAQHAGRIYLDGTPGDANSKLALTDDPANKGLYFKFGSVVGIAAGNNNDGFNAANDVAFNLTCQSDGRAYPITAWGNSNNGQTEVSASGTSYIPSFSKANYETDGIIDVSSNNYHTLANLKIGKGDPCKLVGLTLDEIRTKLKENKTPDNGKYRLPTLDENTDFANQTYYNWTGSGATFKNGVYLPAAGYRYYRDGKVNGQGSAGRYWSSTVGGSNYGYRLYFDNNSVNPQFDYSNYSDGFSVRCVQ